MRVLIGSIFVALVLTGCGIILGEAGPELEPVPAGPLGPVVAPPGGDGPPIECRGIVRERCVEVGVLRDGMGGGIDLEAVERVIVSCIGRCTPDAGEFRIDVLVGEHTSEIARGGYGASQ